MQPPLEMSRRASARRPGQVSLSAINTLHKTLPPPITLKQAVRDNTTNDTDFQAIGEWEGIDNQDSDVVARATSTFQIEGAECVETKVVTTTTTTRRTYPPLHIRAPRALEKRDSKDYPLAHKPTPDELADFTYEVEGEVIHFRQHDRSAPATSQLRQSGGSQHSQSRMLMGASKHQTSERYSHSPLRRNKTDGLPSRPLDRDQHSFMLRRLMGPGSPDSLHRTSTVTDAQKISPFVNTSTASSRQPSYTSDILATPDASDPETRLHGDGDASAPSDDSILGHSFREVQSPSLDHQNSYGGSVATPPIAESDLEAFTSLPGPLVEPSTSRSTPGTAVTQTASLPSPSLSPTLAAANLQNSNAAQHMSNSGDGSQPARGAHTNTRAPMSQSSIDSISGYETSSSSLATTPSRDPQWTCDSMLDTFDAMPAKMQSFMMYEFLRRCNRRTLHVVAQFVNPALKCDFIGGLPIEISLQILSHLDHKDLCSAAQVSKKWRDIVDTNETGWKELLERDEFTVSRAEFRRAISEGWGWQDPAAPDGWEQDLTRKSKSEGLTTEVEDTSTTARPSAKRKVSWTTFHAESSKRRAISIDHTKENKPLYASVDAAPKNLFLEGPHALATYAASVVPAPAAAQPCSQNMHFYKSLYRRHHMLRRSWMDKRVEPQHQAFQAHPHHVITCLQFDDDKIVTGSDDTFIHVYDTKTGKLRKRLAGHDGGVWALQYEGNTLVSGSTDRTVRVWDIERGVCTQVFYGHTSTVRCLQILMPSPTGEYENGKPVIMPREPLIITGSRDSQLRVWRLPTTGSRHYIPPGPPLNDADCPYFVRVMPGHTHSVRAIAASGDTLVSGSYDASVRVWKISTGETLHKLRGHIQKVYSVVLDMDRNRCISGSMDNSVKIWSLETGTCLHTLEGHASLVGLLDLRAERLVSAAADSTLRIWDPETGHCRSTLTAHTGAITCFQHDRDKVISGSDKTLKMWDIRTGECMQDLLTDLSGVWQVKFDERRCVAAVQREGITFLEILDFGASRDGVPARRRGKRILLEPAAVDRVDEVDPAQ